MWLEVLLYFQAETQSCVLGFRGAGVVGRLRLQLALHFPQAETTIPAFQGGRNSSGVGPLNLQLLGLNASATTYPAE